MSDPIDLSVIVITDNNAAEIEATDRELSQVLAGLGVKAELIYVDNGSMDETPYRLERCLENQSIPKQSIELRRNFGKASAFAAGVRASRGRFLLTLDPHLTVDPMEITRAIEEIESGYDLVVGVRQRAHLSVWVRARSRIINKITGLILGIPLRDYGSTFRIMRREFVEDLPLYGELFAFIPAFIYTSGARVTEIPVIYRPSQYIGYEYTFASYITSLFDVITVWFLIRYSYRPMHIFGPLGLAFILLSFMTIIAAFINRATRGISLILTPLPTLAGILLAVGILIMLLGLTTEIIIRSYFGGQGRIPYSIRKQSKV